MPQHHNYAAVDKSPVLETREARLISDQQNKTIALKKPSESSDLTKKSFAERMKTHRFWLVRSIYFVFYSVWMVVMAIGMFIAWLIAMLFI